MDRVATERIERIAARAGAEAEALRSSARNVDRSLILRSLAGDRPPAAKAPKGHKSAGMEAE